MFQLQIEVTICAVVCLAPLDEPYSAGNNQPKSAIPLDEIVGGDSLCQHVGGVEDLEVSEVSECIRAFLEVVTFRNDGVRLSGLELSSIATMGEQLES